MMKFRKTRVSGFQEKVNLKKCDSGVGKESANLRTQGGKTHIMLYFGLHVAKNARPFRHFVIPKDESEPTPKAIGLS